MDTKTESPTASGAAHGSACPLRLPKITPAMRARYPEWIDADGWTQEAVDFACLLREHCPRSPNKAIYRDMWAVVFPDGHIVTGSDLNTEADAWRIALGWPGPEEIDDAMKRGASAVKARLRYYSPNDPSSATPRPNE